MILFLLQWTSGIKIETLIQIYIIDFVDFARAWAQVWVSVFVCVFGCKWDEVRYHCRYEDGHFFTNITFEPAGGNNDDEANQNLHHSHNESNIWELTKLVQALC